MRLLFLTAAVVALSVPAPAQTCTTSWTSAQDGSWSDDGNWTSGAPTSADVACITEPGTYTVRFDRDQSLAGLVVGGSSGTQTLSVDRSLGTLGEGTIGANAVVELNSCGTQCGGLFDVTNALIVEGTLVQRSGAFLLSNGGTVDIASGGTLRVRTSTGSVYIGRATGNLSRIIVRGTFLFDAEGQTPQFVSLTGNLDLAGGTIAVTDGRVDIESAGRWTGGTFDVGEGGYLWFVNGTGATRAFTMSGTYTGTPAGRVSFSSGVVLAAASGGATLDVGGAGIEIDPGSGRATTFRSAGGQLLNTGRIQVRGNNLTVAQGIVRNKGVIEVNSSLWMQEGGVLRNESGGTVEFIGSATVFDIDGTGRILNEGLVARSGGGTTTLAAYRGRAGSEIRVLSGSRLDLLGNGESFLPAGAVATGTGQIEVPQGRLVQGAISPGTEEDPIGTLSWGYPSFASGVGDARLVIDVAEGGASDVLEAVQIPNAVELGGALVIRVSEGYTPQVGDVFTILTTNNTSNAIAGDFDVVVVEGAPDGIAFVVEKSANNSTLTIRAVEAAPGGEIVVSTTEVIDGGVRSVRLTGPGVVGVSAARLECTDCLDAGAFGTIPGEVLDGASIREVRFDLTSPRVFGYYDLVLTQPGLDDLRVPFTVRPLLTAVNVDASWEVGLRMWPEDGPPPIHNFSWYDFYVVTNDFRDAAPVLFFDRPLPERTSMILADTRFGGTTVSSQIYNSLTADDPLEPAIAFARVPPVSQPFETGIEVGLRIDPDAVLFPGETPTGPDDDRVPFGEGQVLTISSQHNISIERAASLVENAIRSTDDATLSGYLSALDVADSGAVREAVRLALGGGSSRYVQGLLGLLEQFVEEANATVQAPPGVVDGAEAAFDAALRVAAESYDADMSATLLDGFAGSTAVAALLQAEFDALGIEPDLSDGALRGGDEPLPPAGQQCRNGDYYQLRRGGRWYKCPNPSGPADPNDKVASDEELSCEFEAVTVDGVETFRCARTYLPLSRAGDPIEYTVQFENLAEATAPATLVTIIDVLDVRFDPSTIEVLGTSSDSTFSYTVSGQEVTFRFVGIDLPPNVTPPEGEGHVTFRVAPRTPLMAGDVIENDASIVFDFNPAIETGTVVHEARAVSDLATLVAAPDVVGEGQPFTFQVGAFNLAGDPASDATVTVSTGGAPIASADAPGGTCTVGATAVCEFDELSEDQAEPITITLDAPPSGVYTIASSITFDGFDGFEANDTDLGEITVSPVSAEDGTGGLREVTLAHPAPNPVRGPVTLRWGLPTAGRAHVRVFDMLGREVAEVAPEADASAGWHTQTWAPALASGVYVVRLDAEVGGRSEVRTRRMVVVR